MKEKKDNCVTGQCPTTTERDTHAVKLSEGSGGREMQALIQEIQKRFPKHTDWSNTSDDGASIHVDSGELVFTTDSYVVTPVFFPGGNIGKIAFCGTVNDLAVMGAKPLGLSLSLILEEGMSKTELFKIIDSIAELSSDTGIPVVTGDTKVVERGAVDKIMITTSGVGITKKVLTETLKPNDCVIVSGGIGEHGTALLAKRYELEVTVESDSKPLWDEIDSVKSLIKQAKDITRGGLSAILNELSEKNNIGILVDEESVPQHEQVRALTEILGIDLYSLACEGRFVCITSPENADTVVQLLKTFNPSAQKIGEVTKGSGVVVQTSFGKKILSVPSGNIVPRIC